MATRSTGLGAVSPGLYRPTVPKDDPLETAADAAPPDDVEGQGDASGEGRGDGPDGRAGSGRPRKPRRSAPSGKTRPRSLHLQDEVTYRLKQYSIEKGVTLSTAANDLLNKVLPHYEVKRLV